jgi:hypothetical protein
MEAADSEDKEKFWFRVRAAALIVAGLVLLFVCCGCQNLSQYARRDMSQISHRTTVQLNPFPVVTSEWRFILRPVTASPK